MIVTELKIIVTVSFTSNPKAKGKSQPQNQYMSKKIQSCICY